MFYDTGNMNYETSYEGFYKGNMFPNEYVPYKNLTYIKPKIK